MYETFFGLERRPFLAVPDTDLFFPTASMTETRQAVERIIRRGEGVSLVFGESGTGKTLLLRMLRKALDVEYTVSLLFNGRLETPKAFLQQVLFDLRLPFSNADETELRLALWDFARQESTPGFVLLIDDAQYLSNSVLEEIRLLMNCDDGAIPFFRVVLAGTVDFEDNLTHPSLDAFNQRVVSRSYLDTLTREETANYVSWQTDISRRRKDGGFEREMSELTDHPGRHGEFRRLDAPHGLKTESIFTDGAKRLIYQLTDGLPRLINQICDAALVLAAERVSRSIDESLLQTAWTQLQQIKDESFTAPPNVAVSEDDNSPTESLDELIARKKSTLVLREFDASIEFGALEDPEPLPSDPPCCDDDWATDDVEELLQTDVPLYVHASPISLDLHPSEDDPEEDSLFVDAVDTAILFPETVAAEDDLRPNIDAVLDKMIVGRIEPEPVAEIEESVVADEISSVDLPETPETTAGCRRLPYPIRRRRIEPDIPRKYRKHRLRRDRLHAASMSLTSRSFEAYDSWIGCLATRILFFPVHLSTPLPPAETLIAETAPMDQETLEQYGREVLAGRPPFVRKEPHYAYQTIMETPLESESYPHPFYELPLSWTTPSSQGENGYGMAYSDFLQREHAEPQNESKNEREAQIPIAQPAAARIPDSPVVRLTLLPCRSESVASTTSLDEHFEEWETVDKRFASVGEPCRRKKAIQNIPIRQASDDDDLTKKIEAVVHRITLAAEKIELAADVSENAGKKIEWAAECVETEVHTVFPTYRELFQQLSDFTEEITILRIKSEARVPVSPLPLSPKQDKRFRTFPVSESDESKLPRLSSPQALFELSNVEAERRVDAKTLFQ